MVDAYSEFIHSGNSKIIFTKVLYKYEETNCEDTANFKKINS